MLWISVGLSAAVAGLLAPGAIQPILRRLNMFDVPNHRSSHVRSTLRGAGIAVIMAIVIGWIVYSLVGGEAWPVLGIVVISVASIGVLGSIEDIRGVRVFVRLAVQFLVSVSASALLLSAFGHSLLWVFLLGAVGVFFVNAANFMDGVNGISSLQGMVVGCNALVIGLTVGVEGLAVLGVLIFGAFGGFLPWNFPKARLFLGDVGSYCLGMLMFCSSLWIWQESGSVFLALAPAAVYIADVVVTLIKRTVRGENILHAHREHSYQLISRGTNSHVLAAILCAAVGSAICALSYASIFGPLGIVSATALSLTLVAMFILLGRYASITTMKELIEGRR